MQFLQSNVLAGAELNVHDFDFVVSNPPYVGFDEADKVQKSVREFEPRVAVFAGKQGLDVIRPLVEQAHAALKPGGWLAMEIGYSMRDAVLGTATVPQCGTIFASCRICKGYRASLRPRNLVPFSRW